MDEQLSYAKAGVDLAIAEATKKQLAKSVDAGDPRVFNRLGAFASLVDGRFLGYEQPVLVLKTEEPGSKQKLALQHGHITSIAYDLINHLVNDILVMGAEPLYVQDCILCGKLESAVVESLVASMAAACHEQGCVLVGGETSEQPGVIEAGLYLLSASIVGVAERSNIIDGSRIQRGDCVLAVASNGLHTNGYSLVRALIERQPALLWTHIDGERFLDGLLRPHKCYYQDFRGLFRLEGLHGIAHITGGGIQGNLQRILPASLDAQIDTSQIRILPIFKALYAQGAVSEAEMLRTFNMGVGMTIVCTPASAEGIMEHLRTRQVTCYPIGEMGPGSGTVHYHSQLAW
jgi:phosphoribosylformylglycinamidine cyclo-ligase